MSLSNLEKILMCIIVLITLYIIFGYGERFADAAARAEAGAILMRNTNGKISYDRFREAMMGDTNIAEYMELYNKANKE